MIITFAVNLIISSIILGYAYIFKLIFFKKKNLVIKNLDFVYGFFLICLIAIFFNFFLPILYLKYILYIIGLSFFLISVYKKKIEINFYILILFLLIFSFFTYWNGNNVDSPVYHIQTINWSHDKKVTFGLAILDWHYAINSIWHIFLSAMQIKFNEFSSIYVISYIIFSFSLTEAIVLKKKYNLSQLTLFLSLSFLLFFSFIHPYKNGIIFNHLGNPEVDTVAMIFFIITGYLFLKYLELKDEETFKLLLLYSMMCPLIKLTYIGSVFFPLAGLIYNKLRYRLIINKVSFLGLFLIFLWSLRNLIQSSCFLFPFQFTCIKTKWSLAPEQVLFYLNQTKSFARDTRLRAKYNDFDHTIYSFDWFLPWFKDYFINDAFLKISLFILIASIISYIIIQITNILKNKINHFKNIIIFSIILFVINFIIWFQAPEIRFGWGILIFFPCLFLSILLIEFKKFEIIFKKFSNLCLIILSLSMPLKNLSYLKLSDLYIPFNKSFNYDQIIELFEVNGLKIYRSKNWMCADFTGLCVNKPKKHYNLKFNNGYLFISTNDYETF